MMNMKVKGYIKELISAMSVENTSGNGVPQEMYLTILDIVAEELGDEKSRIFYNSVEACDGGFWIEDEELEQLFNKLGISEDNAGIIRSEIPDLTSLIPPNDNNPDLL